MAYSRSASRTVAEGALVVQRWAPKTFDIPCEGFDFTGETATMQVRLYPDATGDPLLNLAMTTSPAQGLSISVATEDGATTSTLQIRIDETTIEALLPFPANGQDPDADVALAYALHIGSGQTKRRFLHGSFIIQPGANKA